MRLTIDPTQLKWRTFESDTSHAQNYPSRPRANAGTVSKLMTSETASIIQTAADLLAFPSPPPGWLGAQLRRLQRLRDLQLEHSENLNPGGRRLLNHAIFVTYVDCVDSGGSDAAREILRGDRIPDRSTAAGAEPTD